MDWFSRVSHPYLIRRDDEGDCPHVPPRRRSRSEDEDELVSSSQQHQRACPVLYYITIV